jgi:hypothetical protein
MRSSLCMQFKRLRRSALSVPPSTRLIQSRPALHGEHLVSSVIIGTAVPLPWEVALLASSVTELCLGISILLDQYTYS